MTLLQVEYSKDTLIRHYSYPYATKIHILMLFILLLAVSLLWFQTASADCVSYNSTTMTIRVTCNTDFAHVVSHINDPAILEDRGNGQYILKANLQVDNLDKLTMISSQVSWLKITGSYGLIVYGYLDVDGIRVTSWNESTESVVSQDNTGSTPRAYMRFRLAEDINIANSEISYLGSATTSYKRGVTFDGTNTGTITIRDSDFHHNWYAFYSAGASNIILDSNRFHDNIRYGIDPHTGTHDMQVINNELYNERYGFICSLDCYNIIVEGNKVHDNVLTAIFLSRNTHDSIVRNNEVWNTPTAISLSESPNNDIYDNTIHDITRGIYFNNPSMQDDGQTTNNNAHNNIITSATYGIVSSRAIGNTVENNNITVSGNDYYLSYISDLHIQNQNFSNDKIRGTSGNNTITIANSGNISVNGGPAIDTDASSYTDSLTFRTIRVSTAQ